jgi:flavin-dependent dehydrogenase
MSTLPKQTEIFVVGGGPAGLSAAIALRQRGLEVMVADHAQPPIDKACGEGIMPDGLAALHELGIAPGAGEGFPFCGIRFVENRLAAAACFPDGCGLGMRRPLLHGLLMERAAEVGVVMRWAATVSGLEAGGVRIGECKVACRWVIGADGYNSRVRRWAGIGSAWSSTPRVGLRQHFRIRPWTDFVEVHWRERCQAYVTPIGRDEVCIALIGGASSLHMTELAALFPQLGRRLAGASPAGPVRGAVSASTVLRQVTRGRVALIGDAAGSVDAVTGEGLSLAFRQSAALADALAENDLALYEAAHRRISRIPRLMARLLLMMDRRSGVRRRALRALASRPRAFSRLLAVHVGALRPAAISLDVLGLGWELLGAGASEQALAD